MVTERRESGASTIPDQVTADLGSESWAVRKEAMQTLGGILLKDSMPAVADAAAQHLDRLAGDEKWEVRNAVAAALQHLLHRDFDRIIAKLIEDPNGFVRRSAAQTLQRRRQVAEHAGSELEGLLREVNHLRSRYSHELADKALRIGRTYYQVMAAGTAHDILNVLTALKQSLRSLEKLLPPRTSAKRKWEPLIENARRRCTIIEHIAGDLKTFADRTPSEFHRENVLEMVKEALSIIEDRFRNDPTAPKVKKEIVVDDRLTIDAPRVRLVPALTNVIKNSYESFSKRGVLAITARVNEKDLVLDITDNGCGMADEVRMTAFMPGTSTKKGKPGRTDNTGMGLAIASEVIKEKCGGDIRIDSTEGRGTRVTIIMPITRRAEGGE